MAGEMPSAMRAEIEATEPNVVFKADGNVKLDAYRDCARRGVLPTRRNQLAAVARFHANMNAIAAKFGATTENVTIGRHDVEERN